MTDSTTADGAQVDTGAHTEHPLLAEHEPNEALAMGRRMSEPAAAEDDRVVDTSPAEHDGEP